ncbi:resistance to lethality of mkk1p386 overexpression [Malassezia yamatoensis]|uniref:Resistance to lethality of mkk1p386 overexpression n=1 Tax=Malassezia yamatoensis TaxID=253288 RepID=A0AAJ5YW01_9BASI|nr:resistance to lethality of mkk1p386 overexpression [Malassezia yamatoensis]
MGRKKIRIEPIQCDRNRLATYLKRKNGLFKKARELAVLTDSDVAVIVFGKNGKVAEFCSGNMDKFLVRYTEYKSTLERRNLEQSSKDSLENEIPLEESLTAMSTTPEQDPPQDRTQCAGLKRRASYGQVFDVKTPHPASLLDAALEHRKQSATSKDRRLYTASGMQDSIALPVPELFPSDLAQLKNTALRMASNWDRSHVPQMRSNASAQAPFEMQHEDSIRAAHANRPHRLQSLAFPPWSSDLRRSASASFSSQNSFHAERLTHLQPPAIPTRHSRISDLGVGHKFLPNGPSSSMQASSGYALPMEMNYLNATAPPSNLHPTNRLASPRPPDILLPLQPLPSSQHRIDIQGPSTSALTPNPALIYPASGQSSGLDVSPLTTPAASKSPLSPLPASIPSYLVAPDVSITPPPSTDVRAEKCTSPPQTSTQPQSTPYSTLLTPDIPGLAVTGDASEVHVPKP